MSDTHTTRWRRFCRIIWLLIWPSLPFVLIIGVAVLIIEESSFAAGFAAGAGFVTIIRLVASSSIRYSKMPSYATIRDEQAFLKRQQAITVLKDAGADNSLAVAVANVVRDANATGELVTLRYCHTLLAQFKNRLTWSLVASGIAIAALALAALWFWTEPAAVPRV